MAVSHEFHHHELCLRRREPGKSQVLGFGEQDEQTSGSTGEFLRSAPLPLDFGGQLSHTQCRSALP